MILQRVDMANWRCLTGAISLGPLSEGITILHAPNGTGKSALFEAVRFAFFDAHNVSGEDVSAIRPWGRELSPEVTVEFQVGERRYRITKKFLSSKKSLLERWEEDQFRPLAEGRAADAEVRTLLRATLSPGRGCSRPEHWGLQQILWTPQEGLRFLHLPDAIGSQLKAALGIAPLHEDSVKITTAVEELYHQQFTPTGALRKNAAVTALEIRAQELASSLSSAQERLVAYENAIRQVEDARLAKAQLAAEAAPIELQLAEVQHSLVTFDRLKTALETTEITARSLAERLAKLRSDLERITMEREWIRTSDCELTTLKAELATLEMERSATANLLTEASRERASLSKVAEAAAEAEQLLFLAKEWHTVTLEERSLATRLSRCQELDGALRNAKTIAAALPCPETKSIANLRTLAQRESALEAALQASRLELVIHAENPLTLSHLGHEQSVAAGSVTRFHGEEIVEVDLHGFGRITAQAPRENHDARRSDLEKIRSERNALASNLPSDNPERLQQLREEALAAQAAVREIEGQWKTLLNGETLDHLIERHAKLRMRISELEVKHPSWVDEPPALAAIQEAAEQALRDVRQKREANEASFQRLQAAENRINVALAATEERIRALEQSMAAAKGRLATATADGRSDEERLHLREQALLEWEAADSKRRQLKREIEALGPDPRVQIASLKARLKGLQDAMDKARDRENQAAGRLETLSEEGAYTKAILLQEEFTRCAEELDRERLEVEAVKLLHKTLTSAMAEAEAGGVAPIEREASRIFEQIHGTRLGPVGLSPQFTPLHISPREVGNQQPPVSQLSGGEREQVYFATRLAIARVLAQEERQCFILDDALNATDSARFARMLRLLEESARFLQILVFTCHPERFALLQDAEFVDLTAVLKAAW